MFMSRTHRLLQLMQSLRSFAPPVTAERLSNEMHVSLRTIYRDIETLRGLGAVIDGEAGFGYTLIEDAALPPLAFDDDELEALVLGLREVTIIGDPALASAANSALAKIQARVPASQAQRLKHAVLDAQRFARPTAPTIDVARLRRATREEFSVRFDYEDAKGRQTQRMVKPLGIVYLENTSMLSAWCHLREDFRVFRLDRMRELEVTDLSFRPHRVALLRDHLERIRAETEKYGSHHH